MATVVHRALATDIMNSCPTYLCRRHGGKLAGLDKRLVLGHSGHEAIFTDSHNAWLKTALMLCMQPGAETLAISLQRGAWSGKQSLENRCLFMTSNPSLLYRGRTLFCVMSHQD